MAEKDMTEKALEAYDDVFADIVNNLIFEGKKRVQEKDLEQGRERSVYMGEKTLREQARTLHEVIGDRMEEDLKPYVHDYGINLFEIAYLTDEELNGFQSDFRFVADYFVQMQRAGRYTGSKEKVKHIREVLQLLAVLTNDIRFYTACEAGKGERMVGTMSEALDEIENRGIRKGIETIAGNLIAMGMSNEQIMQATGLSEIKIKELRQSIMK